MNEYYVFVKADGTIGCVPVEGNDYGQTFLDNIENRMIGAQCYQLIEATSEERAIAIFFKVLEFEGGLAA